MLYRYFVAYLIIFFFISGLEGQCPSKPEILDKVFIIENNTSHSDEQKLKSFYALQKTASNCLKDKDSVYAWIFLKIGKYEFLAYLNYENTIKFTRAALQANNYSKKGASIYLNINAYFNLGSAYETLLSYTQALKYYDSSIYLASRFIDTNAFALDARKAKANIHFSLGDYQKAVEESIQGAHLAEIENNVFTKIAFLNMQAQALLFQQNTEASLPIAYAAATASKNINNAFQLATAYKTIALIYNRRKLLDSAKYYYSEAINYRLKTKDYSNIGADYNEFGNFYNGLNDYEHAAKCYEQFLYYAGKITDPVDRSVKIAFAYLNYGENYFKQNKLMEAGNLYLKAMNTLKFNVKNILQTPSINEISVFSNRAELIIALMNNKTELLLEQYKKNKKKEFLDACIQTARVTDSVITQIRHEEIGELSKLHWRNKTRNFFTLAMEACYQANDPGAAFYFMERSRAVLLTDQLNEIGAAAILPKAEIAKQKNYQDNLVQLERKLLILNESAIEYQHAQVAYLSEKANFERYIDSLEITYPIYYQYKYADKVPTIKELQFFLAKSHQSFVHYYMDDSVTYILAITPSATQFKKLSRQQFDKNSLLQFLQLCSDKQALNNNYKTFVQLSNTIYKGIFQPLHLPKGRTIICSDNIVIPFEALCTDAGGKQFLINDHGFSYVYSARFLMKKFENATASRNFTGFAPVSFRNYLHVAELKNADKALYAAAGYYNNDQLFTHENASRSNFFKYAPYYSIVSIFSHASADTTGNEPVLYMQDSLIYLSELQRLNNPAIQLVLLSACQTNVGRAATGEGIYSLARGFATAGIPSVAATLWKADEQTIYIISEKFNQYLSGGMNKDEALQKAKLYFTQQNNSNGKLLPYYWANMILIGNTEAIELTSSGNNYWWWILGGCSIVLILLFILKKKFSTREIKR